MRFYCEHHENIRIVHVSVTLPSPADALTALDIYDRKTLRLRHAFQSYTIALPASLTVTQLPRPIIVGNTWTYRIAADVIKKSGSNEVPLSSPDSLQSLQCIKCNTRILSSKALDWRLLPSENWMELMDSWHCHRGVSDEHHHEIHDQYALPDHIVSAAERIHARPGMGLLGPSHMLIHQSDMSPDVKVYLPQCVCGLVLMVTDCKRHHLFMRSDSRFSRYIRMQDCQEIRMGRSKASHRIDVYRGGHDGHAGSHRSPSLSL